MHIEEIQTPAYIYDLPEVRRCHALLRSALPDPSDVYYSLKANPHPDIAAALGGLGAGAEVCSSGELEVALAAGYPPERILYTGPGKSDLELSVALKAGVQRFSVDSPHAIDQLDRLAGDVGTHVECLVRVNDDTPAPGQRLTMTGVVWKFGADAAWIEAEPERFASRSRVRVRQVLRADLTTLDLGGGFGAPYARAGDLPTFPTLAVRLAELLDDAFAGWRRGTPRILFESGRYLTATCGRLRTQVLDVKRSQGQPVVVLESGINHLGGMSGLRRLPQIVPDLCGEVSGEPVPDTLVAGPLCTPLDVWAGRARTAALAPGDLVEIPDVGAYGLSASLFGFLSHPLPTEVVVDNGWLVGLTRLRLRREPTSQGGEE